MRNTLDVEDRRDTVRGRESVGFLRSSWTVDSDRLTTPSASGATTHTCSNKLLDLRKDKKFHKQVLSRGRSS